MPEMPQITAFGLGLMIAASAPATAQTLTVGVGGGPVSLDPHVSTAPAHVEALKHIYDTLLWADEDSQPAPRLADGWRMVSPLVWEFKLRSGVRFHDGSPLEAEDVKFSIERARDMAAENNPAREVRSVSIAAPNMLRVETAGPDPILPARFTRLFIVSGKLTGAVAADARRAAFDTGRIAVGTGPYRAASWRAGAETVFDRFEGFWGEQPHWARLIRKEIPDGAARIAALRASEVDIAADIPAGHAAEITSSTALTLQTKATARFLTLALDLRDSPRGLTAADGSPLPKNPFADPRVRIAIDLALDRQTLADGALAGLAKPVSQIANRAITGYSRSIALRTFNAAAARKLLVEAGYPAGFRLALSVPQSARAAGEAVAAMLSAAGLEVSPAIIADAALADGLERGDLGPVLLPWSVADGDSFATLATLAHSRAGAYGRLNTLGYANPRLDRMIENAATEIDPDLRRGLLEQASAAHLRDFRLLPLVNLDAAWAMPRERFALTARADGETLAMAIKPAK